MSIIISNNGNKAVKVDKSSFDKEDYLQNYIHENPESIPLYDIKEDIRLLILAREFSTNSGPIDALGIDQYGELYIVETKLYKNPDKRTVISQALDYGASLWNHSRDFADFIAELNKHTQKTFGCDASSKIKDFFSYTDEEVSDVLQRIKQNLNEGIFHFVILMDKMDSKLKDLILFVNQNSKFDIYAVEFEYYKHETQEIIIPRIYGAEVKKDINVSNSSSSSSRESWNEEKFLNRAKENLAPEYYARFKKVYDFAKESADLYRFGTGQVGSCSPIWHSIQDKSLFSLFVDGRIHINLHWLVKEDGSNQDKVSTFKQKLEEIGFVFPEYYNSNFSKFFCEEWIGKSEEFVEVVKQIV